MPVLLPNASIGQVSEVMKQQDRIIAAYPEVEMVLGKAGRAETATDNAPVSMVETIILLKPRDRWRDGLTKELIESELDSMLRIPGVRNGWTQPIINRINMLSTGVRTELGVKIYGENLDTLEAYAIRAEQILKSVDGASDVTAERVQGGSFLDITVDDRAIARYGLRLRDVQMLIETAIGGENIGQVIEGRARYPIRVRYQRELRDNVDAIREMLVPIRGGTTGSAPAMATSVSGGMNRSASGDVMRSGGMSGGGMAGGMQEQSPGIGIEAGGFQGTGMDELSALSGGSTHGYVRIGDIARVSHSPGPSMISSENGQLRSVVFLNVRDRDIGSYVDEAEKRLEAGLGLPVGYTYEWSGQYENKRSADARLKIVVPIVLLLIFVMLFMTMRDWGESLLILLTVPLGLVGGIYLLYALDYNFSIAVWVGFISLYGVAVQTGIVMVIYLRQSLDDRLTTAADITHDDINAAAIDGSVERLRPKLMAIATTMIGLAPVMFSDGVGSDVMKPMMTPTIGGLFTAASSTLLLTPVLFAMLKDRALSKGKLERSRMVDWMS
jgi:copper/silver efflux system protein